MECHLLRQYAHGRTEERIEVAYTVLKTQHILALADSKARSDGFVGAAEACPLK